jgi:hypothetical protein
MYVMGTHVVCFVRNEVVLWPADATHTFCARAPDWGFRVLVSLEELHNPARGFLVDNTLKVRAAAPVPHPFSFFYMVSGDGTACVPVVRLAREQRTAFDSMLSV